MYENVWQVKAIHFPYLWHHHRLSSQSRNLFPVVDQYVSQLIIDVFHSLLFWHMDAIVLFPSHAAWKFLLLYCSCNFFPPYFSLAFLISFISSQFYMFPSRECSYKVSDFLFIKYCFKFCCYIRLFIWEYDHCSSGESWINTRGSILVARFLCAWRKNGCVFIFLLAYV